MTGTLTPLFTPENAKEFAAKSVESRRIKRLQGELAVKRLAELEILDKISPPNQRAERLERQLNEIELQMIGADCETKQKLSAAHARLFDAWCVLTQTSRPSPSRSRRREKLADVQPLAQEPSLMISAKPPDPAKPLGWEYDAT